MGVTFNSKGGMITPTTLRSSTRALLVASSRARTFTRLPALRVQRQSTMASDQQIIFTKDAPAALGPYSQAIKTPSTIYCSGQIPLKPDGTFVEGSIAEKTEQCCKNVKAVVEAAGSSMGEVNGEYEKWFSHKPARSCVAVKTLPKNVDVEI